MTIPRRRDGLPKRIQLARRLLKAVVVLVLSLSMLQLVLAAAARGGRQLYISPSGDDRKDGSAAHPWATLSRAARAASAGDTIHVGNGNYVETQTVYFRNSGTPTLPIRLIGDSYSLSQRTWGAKIRIDIPPPEAPLIVLSGDYIEIVGLELTTSNQTTSYSGIRSVGRHNRIADNHIHHIGTLNPRAAGGCIDLGTGADYNLVESNFCHHSGPDPWSGVRNNHQHGIYVAANQAVVRNNVFAFASGKGIHVYNSETVSPRDCVVVNNTVFHNKDGMVSDGTNCIIANNIFYDNKEYGLYEGADVGTNNSYFSNLLKSNGYGDRIHYEKRDTKAFESGTLSVDPQFLNYQLDGSGDYHIGGAGPALVTNMPKYCPKDDYAHLTRSQSSNCNLGAFETLGRGPR